MRAFLLSAAVVQVPAGQMVSTLSSKQLLVRQAMRALLQRSGSSDERRHDLLLPLYSHCCLRTFAWIVQLSCAMSLEVSGSIDFGHVLPS